MRDRGIPPIRRCFILGVLIFFISGCEYESPNPVWPPEEYSGENPIITSVEPENPTGALRLTILGQNFAPEPERNSVYFNGTLAEIISATSSEIMVYRPPVVGDSVAVHVFVDSTLLIAKTSYRLDETHSTYSGLTRITALAIDGEENIYALGNREIFYLTNDGQELGYVSGDAFPRSFRSGPEARYGPGGVMYFVSASRRGSSIFRALGAEDSLALYCEFDGEVITFDFDENGNIYGAGDETGISVATPMAGKDTVDTLTNYDEFADFSIVTVRVFNGHVYFAGEYGGSDGAFPEVGIWRVPIESGLGQIGDAEVVYDWANSSDSTLADILDFTIAADGTLYIATDNTNPIFILSPDGELDLLYKGIFPNTMEKLIWGNSTYIYGINSDAGIFRIQTGKQGAVYQGRQ